MIKDLKKSVSHIKQSLRVRDIMSREVVSLTKDRSVYDAVSIMADKSISTIVIEENKKPLGVITERDLVKKILAKQKELKKLKLSDIMTEHPKEIRPDVPILAAGNMMKTDKVRKLVVVDEKGEVIGLLSQTDIINSLNRIYESYRSILSNPLVCYVLIGVIIILVILSIIFRL